MNPNNSGDASERPFDLIVGHSPGGRMEKTKEIEIHSGERPRRRINIDIQCTALNVPVFSNAGYSEISYSASGILAEDGVEIWTPYAGVKQ